MTDNKKQTSQWHSLLGNKCHGKQTENKNRRGTVLNRMPHYGVKWAKSG